MNKKSTRDIGLELEKLVVAYFKDIDAKTRLSRASGALMDVADIVNKEFYIECKKRDTANLTINIKVWSKLCNKIPIGSMKTPLLILQNNDNDIFVVCNIQDFVRIIKEKK